MREKQKENKDEKKYGCIHPPPVHRPLRWGYSACFLDKFSEIEEIVNGGEPVYLTKNGYGTMVVMSLERYASLTDFVETKLDEADRIAETSEERYSHERVFGDVRKAVDGNEDL
ncbi:MAG: type II toxin-antitoxin system Phd/YefM family antitoxin [[Clostridium] innocuum]